MQLLEHAASNLLGFDCDLFSGQERYVVWRHAQQPAAIGFFRIRAVLPPRRVDKISCLAQPGNESSGNCARQQIAIPRAYAIPLARAFKRNIAQLAGVVGVVRHADRVVARKSRQYGFNTHTAPEGFDGCGMNSVEALVLENQFPTPFKQSGLAARSSKPVAINWPGRDCIELDLRP